MRRASFLAALAFSLAFAAATPAGADAPDEYGHNTFLSLGVEGVRVEMNLTPGPLVGSKFEALIEFSAAVVSLLGLAILSGRVV